MFTPFSIYKRWRGYWYGAIYYAYLYMTPSKWWRRSGGDFPWVHIILSLNMLQVKGLIRNFHPLKCLKLASLIFRLCIHNFGNKGYNHLALISYLFVILVFFLHFLELNFLENDSFPLIFFPFIELHIYKIQATHKAHKISTI